MKVQEKENQPPHAKATGGCVAHCVKRLGPSHARKTVIWRRNLNVSPPDGVVVAQGGTAQGYTLFLEKGRLTFLLRINGESTSITAPEPISGRHTAIARVASSARDLVTNGTPKGHSRHDSPACCCH